MRDLFYTTVARVRQFLRPGTGEADFDQEIDAHLAMAEEEKVRAGMSREQARRDARLELGGVAQLRESARAARGLPWLDSFWLDGKLAVRMLRKSWGLTLVGGLAMALTIGLGASIFTIWNAFAGTSLPLDEGDRVVAIQTFDMSAQRVDRATPIADIARWRDTLTSVERVGAMRPMEPLVITRDGPAGLVRSAEMTASAFQVARVQPILGRGLIEQDESDGAEPVAVIGYDIWQSGFSSDRGVVGQRINIADRSHVIVGVMPAGFRFPINQHLWTPLRTDPLDEQRARGEGVFVFGRLKAGATMERAQAEVATVGVLPRGTAADREAHFQFRVVPYTAGIFSIPGNHWVTGLVFLLGALLLVPPCANIAILVYAKTVTRREEFAARAALGASRSRIVMQLFVEVLVLASAAGVAGFLLARQFSERLARIVMPGTGPDQTPFWIDYRPSLATILCVAGLSVVAAVIAGGVPAFHATGRWKRSGFDATRNLGAGARLGKTWMALLAAQVALSLAVLPSASEMAWGTIRPTIVGPGLPVDRFLTGSLAMDGDRARFESLSAEAVRQLATEIGISGVTTSSSLLMQEPFARIEVEGIESSETQTKTNTVDETFFELLGARVLAGRRFETRDLGSASASVIVNRSFVNEVIGGANALGRRVRYASTGNAGLGVDGSTRYEIIGVVDDFFWNEGPMMYHAMTRSVHPINLAIRASSGIGAAAGQLRAVVSRVDSRLRLGRLRSMSEIYSERRAADQMFGVVLGSVMVIVLLFSIAGMYTLMAFVIAQRWREVGLRAALGARPLRLVGGIFGRAFIPLLVGAIAGSVVGVFIHSALPIEEAGGQRIPGVIPMTAVVMIVAGLLAVAGPARRALRVNPTDVLRMG